MNLLLPGSTRLIMFLLGISDTILLVVAGFCMFVLSLVKKHYRLQFYMVSSTYRLKATGLLMTLVEIHALQY